MIRAAFHDLMDRMPGAEVVGPVRSAAMGVPGVLAIEKLHLRKAGMGYQATIHVHADPAMSLVEAHALGGRVKRAICAQSPHVDYVLVHMEPFDPKAL
jgi:divalent metal cation (Fe/Co/Zn/Cd) transporter